jgi:hypothetical protein
MITIKVTLRDIKNGTTAHCKYCPVARALRRQLHRRKVSVGTDCFYLGDASTSSSLPARVQRFIYEFDNGVPVKPFSFCIKDPR